MSFFKKIVKGVGKGIGKVFNAITGSGGGGEAPPTPININLGGLVPPSPVGQLPASGGGGPGVPAPKPAALTDWTTPMPWILFVGIPVFVIIIVIIIVASRPPRRR